MATSLTTMLRSPIVRVASVRTLMFQLPQMGISPASFRSFQLAHKVANVGCRYSSTDSLRTRDSRASFGQIILGSSSMARKQILAEMGYEFSILTADIDEKSIRKDKPEELVMALAQAKADAIIARLQTMGEMQEDAHATLLITADTVVVYKGIVREKPTSKEEARYFIKGYSGDHAAVVGSVLVTNLATGKRKGAWETAEVYFHEIPDKVIDRMIEEGVTFNVAGGLMLEHPLTSPFVKAVMGNTDTVMGLPKSLTEKLISGVL